MKQWLHTTMIGCTIALLSLTACKGPAPRTDHGPFREKLSEFGFFSGPLSDLRPIAGILPYELATPLFTDYALKRRFIVLPAGKTMQYRDSGAIGFPDSTFIIKNFAYTDTMGKQVMIETRLLFKDPADGRWQVMNYLWDSSQTDAKRWIVGQSVPVTLLDDHRRPVSTHYQVPNTNDCKRCHSNNGEVWPIGPKARNLHAHGQLRSWAAAGLLTGLPGNAPELPVWTDSLHYSPAQRARAYLDVNCAHCHTKGGDADNTGLFLEYEQTAPNRLGIFKGPVAAGNGAGGLNYDVVPGHAEQSILWYRMNSREPGVAMPELARTLIHREGVDLIAAWINQLKENQ
ncbi:SO2930 family diheme c-type cytochrome [Chitinophaga lutea]